MEQFLFNLLPGQHFSLDDGQVLLMHNASNLLLKIGEISKLHLARRYGPESDKLRIVKIFGIKSQCQQLGITLNQCITGGIKIFGLSARNKKAASYFAA